MGFSRIKKIPFLGDILVVVKNIPRYLICSIINRWYYFLHNNFPRPREKYVITDTPPKKNGGGLLRFLNYIKPGDTLSDLPGGEAFMDTDRRGFFSIILAILDEISTNSEKEIHIKLNRSMFNDNPEDNMWDYYFEPVQSSNNGKSSYRPSFNIRPYRDALITESQKHLELFSKIVKDKIRIKSDILKKVESFKKENFGNKKIIGVHCRGSNIMLSINSVSHLFQKVPIERYFEEIDKWLIEGYDNIFLATDDERIFKKFTERYGHKLIHYSSKRSDSDTVICHYPRDNEGRPIGINFTPRELGEEVLIDCLLLSESDFLISGSSNIPAMAKFFNPDLRSKNFDLKYKSRIIQKFLSIGL